MQQKRTNGFAIAGLILSLFISAVLGLIFSIIGLKKSKEYNSGRGLSIAGIIISVLKIILTVICILIFMSLIKTDTFKNSFCDELAKNNQYESLCTKKDDGSYDCIFLTCKFDKKDSSKVTKEELSEAIVSYLDKNATIDKKTLKVTITKATGSSSYKDEIDMIVYDTNFTIECTDKSDKCLKLNNTIPGIPVTYGSSATDIKVSFENGKVEVSAPLIYSQKTKKLEWSTSPSKETVKLEKTIELK